MATPLEVEAMRRAIAISAFGLGSASPNPPVGCVILSSDGRFVGEGYHLRKGESHAEVNALAAASDRAQGGTAVVTLEPCNHQGRTPPCRQALIDAGIRRVVIAMIDPTSREEGGAARLRAAGVDVEVDVLSDEARLVLGPWLASLISGLPDVEWRYLATAEGPLAQASIPDDELAMARGHFDAVLMPDRTFEEGRPGAHGPDVFSLPAEPEFDLSEKALADLHARGVRSLLVNGWSPEAETAFVEGHVRQAAVYLETQLPSSSSRSDTRLPSIPETANLVAITRTPGYVHLRFVSR